MQLDQMAGGSFISCSASQILSKIPPKTTAEATRHNGMTDGYLPNLKGKMKAVQLMDGSMDGWTMADRSSG